MKKSLLTLLFWPAVMLVFVSCTLFGNKHNTTIKLSESEQDYTVMAHYPLEETGKVENYLARKLGSESHVSFSNTNIDADLTLDDGTTFYIKHKPGDLSIRFDKDKNTAASYRNIKALGTGLKDVLK